jgi:putative FmdB family regulatory protein
MPTYEYACTGCGERLEVVQRFTDDPLTVCPECEGALRKVFSPVGVVFKGSGFYKTDSRGSGSSTGTTDSKTPAKEASADPAPSTTTAPSKPAEPTSSSSTSGGTSGTAERVA